MAERYDYVVIGAGASGCILASRLSERPETRVLLIEAGARRFSPLLTIPAGETLLLGDPRFDWKFRTEPDPTLGGRSVQIPRGRLLGGSNAINGMIFVRGQRADFDDWARSGVRGWAWDDVLPFFRKLEDWQGGANAARGMGGPIRVELPRQREVLCDIFLRAATQAGFPSNPDYNSGNVEGFGYYQCTQKAGRRASVVGGYLAHARGRPNLDIITEATVTELRFDDRRCIGVSYVRGRVVQMVDAAREVILAAGVVGSPHLLELSGIGNPAVLARAGVASRHALPGVGENFRDHFAARLRWRITQRVTFNERTRGLRLAGEVLKYAVCRRGVLSLPIAIGFGFVRSTAEEPVPDLQFHFAPASYGGGSTRRLDAKPGMTIGVYPTRPESRGSIHLRDPDPRQPPAINSRFLSSPEDVRRLVSGLKIARRIVASQAFDPFRGEETTPGADVADDEALRLHTSSHGDTSYHPVGTCRMGEDTEAVVDSRLRVRGLSGLRVVDASVMPTLVSGNTQAATMMIAEKGAAMILNDARPS